MALLRPNLPAAGAFLLPVFILLGGWMNHIHNQFGDWSLTTMTGYHMVQHTGIFFEYVPDEHAALSGYLFEISRPADRSQGKPGKRYLGCYP
jgi:hypothetical protein